MLPFDERWTGTPVPHLLRSNNPPTEAERKIVYSLLQEYERELRDLNAESWAHLDSLDDEAQETQAESTMATFFGEYLSSRRTIHSQIDFLEDAQKKHLGILSFIRVLPPELVSEIFRYARDRRVFHEKQTTVIDYGGLYKYHYGFTQVCSRWRLIALDTPWLWTEIPAVYEMYRGTRITGYAHLVCAFLERSKALPLDIAVHIRYQYDRGPLEDDGDDRGASFPLILRPLLDASTRWKTALLYLHEDHIRHLPQLKLPILQQLNIRIFDDNPRVMMVSGDLSFPLNLLGPTPMLKVVISDGQYNWHGEDDIKPRQFFQGVEKFIGLPKTSTDLECAQSSLVNCILRGPLSRIMVFPDTILEFPVMKTLQVIHNNYQNGRFGWTLEENIFQCIRTPRLESLLVEGHPDIDDADAIILHIVQTTLPAASRLTSLTIHIAGLTKENLTKVLLMTPDLEELHVYEGGITWFDWADLIAGPSDDHGGQTPLLRKLRSLVIDRANSTVLGSLYAATESRRSQMSPDSQDVSLSIHVNFIGRPSLLRSLSLTPGWEDKSFEEWERPARGSEHTKLNGWALFLAKAFMGFHMWFFRKKVRGKRIKRHSCVIRWTSEERTQLDKVLKAMEGHQVEDPRLLEVSGILFAMEELARPPESHYVLGCAVFRLRHRAKVLSETWRLLLEARKSEMPQCWRLSEDGLSAVLPNDAGTLDI